jgi:alanine racemase
LRHRVCYVEKKHNLMMEIAGRPTVAEIDLNALRSNYHALKSAAPRSELMVVVKADAYGHGATIVSRVLAAEGCRYFGVATIDEARELRESGLDARIFLQAGFFASQAREIVELDLTPFVFHPSLLAPLENAALDTGRKRFPIHVKIDTGATRLGVMPSEIEDLADRLRAAPTLMLEGLCTLLANAGDPTSEITDSQMAVFRSSLASLGAAGFIPKIAHVANSAALLLRDDSHFDLARPGLAIYGLPPVPAVREKIDLRPVMTFKTRLMQLKRVKSAVGIGYGHTFKTRRESTIGVLPVGYADGYKRNLQHGGEVLIRGHRAPVVGAVSMDLTTIDITEVPDAAVGDEVILWGGAGEAMINVNDVARLVQTISYEMLCTVGKRVPRICRG